LRPNNTAPVAPGIPMCERACDANVILRSMMKYPSNPVQIESSSPPIKALMTKCEVRMSIISEFMLTDFHCAQMV
jgi:hypothetical protein